MTLTKLYHLDFTLFWSSFGFFATFWNSESDMSESESEESIMALDLTLCESLILEGLWSRGRRKKEEGCICSLLLKS